MPISPDEVLNETQKLLKALAKTYSFDYYERAKSVEIKEYFIKKSDAEKGWRIGGKDDSGKVYVSYPIYTTYQAARDAFNYFKTYKYRFSNKRKCFTLSKCD